MRGVFGLAVFVDEGLVDLRAEDLGDLGAGVFVALSGRREVWTKTGISEGWASE